MLGPQTAPDKRAGRRDAGSEKTRPNPTQSGGQESPPQRAREAAVRRDVSLLIGKTGEECEREQRASSRGARGSGPALGGTPPPSDFGACSVLGRSTAP